MNRIKAITDNFSRGELYGVYDCGDNNEMKLFRNTTEEDFMELISAVSECGCEKMQSSDIDNFISCTFCEENTAVVISYDRAVKEIRIISDPRSAALNTAVLAGNKCPVRLWQFEVDHTLIDCGMCYIIQCSDYSFFVIDSAHTFSFHDDERIYELLRKETPEGMKVRVAGWFLSHAHDDHIVKFLDVLRYNKDIQIDGLYFNFVPNTHFSSGSWMASDKKHVDNFYTEINKRSDIPVYKLHAGQYFYIDKIRFDVLCAQEDIYPAPLDNYNDSSAVLMMSVDGNKVCFPGDGGAYVSDVCERRFPDFLRCDIIQVAHHGHFGTTENFYRLTSSHVALFAVTEIKFNEEYPRYAANRTACDIAEHTFIASNGTVMFTFPLENSEILVYADETDENFDGILNLWNYDYTEEFKREHRERFEKRNKAYTLKY